MKELLRKVNSFKSKYNEMKGEQKLLQKQLDTAKYKIDNKSNELEFETKVSELLYATSKASKNHVKNFIENICSEMLTYVYEEKHGFTMEVLDRRNKHECDYFIKDKSTCVQLKKPFVGKGGGKVTLVAVTLRLAVIELLKLKGVVFIDEPLRMTDGTAAPRFAEFLQQYSAKFNRQIVVVTHNKAIIDASDSHYHVVKKKGISEVRREK